MSDTDSPWIPLTGPNARQPQASDWDNSARVLLYSEDRTTVLCAEGLAHFKQIMAHYLGESRFAYFLRVELPPLPPKEMTQDENDCAGFTQWMEKRNISKDGYFYSDLGWHAALAHERAYLGMPAEQFVKELRGLFKEWDDENSHIDDFINGLRQLLDRANKGKT